MNDYIINSNTLYIIENTIDDGNTLIAEKDKEIISNFDSFKIVKKSCGYYGYSYRGQRDFIVEKLSFAIKTPIIISNYKNIIFFPTSSPNLKKCIWIAYNNIDRYIKDNDNTKIFFKGGKTLSINTSFTIIDNQVTKCIKIEKFLSSLVNE